MKVFIPEISWHERDPVYTCAFHPITSNKFATASVTGTIRVYTLSQKRILCFEKKLFNLSLTFSYGKLI